VPAAYSRQQPAKAGLEEFGLRRPHALVRAQQRQFGLDQLVGPFGGLRGRDAELAGPVSRAAGLLDLLGQGAGAVLAQPALGGEALEALLAIQRAEAVADLGLVASRSAVPVDERDAELLSPALGPPWRISAACRRLRRSATNAL
jgi:hypothetical protein